MIERWYFTNRHRFFVFVCVYVLLRFFSFFEILNDLFEITKSVSGVHNLYVKSYHMYHVCANMLAKTNQQR